MSCDPAPYPVSSIRAKSNNSDPFIPQVTTQTSFNDIIYPRKLRFFSVTAQIITVTVLFVAFTLLSYSRYATSGHFLRFDHVRIEVLFAPIYEEFIFRGLILSGLTRFYSPRTSIIISSILFGLWHLKNLFFWPMIAVVRQILWVTLLIGPVLGYTTLKTKNVWIAVMLHYLYNLWAEFGLR